MSKTESSLDHFYNRYDGNKNWKRMLFLSGLGIQAPEFNELQDMVADHIKGIGDALFSDGHIVEGCGITIDIEGCVAKLDAGRVYIDGQVWSVTPATLRVPADDTAQIGVRLCEKTITYHQDGSLRDPSEGCPNYNKPGAARLVKWAEWGINTEVMLSGQLYPIYTINNLIVVNTTKPASQVDDFMNHLARYDRESSGFYIIEGLRVQALQDANGVQAYSIGSGKAHVQGYEVTVSPSRRFLAEGEANILDAEAEPHTFTPDGTGHMRLDVNHAPVDAIQKIGVTYENTVQITHGAYSGCMDNLPHTSVTAIVSIKQGATTYTPSSDYRLTADKVDWSPTGGEPAPGSKYDITYQYRGVLTPSETDAKGFDITGIVPGSLVLVDYSYRLPRKDLICLDRNGDIHLIKGVAHRFAPIPPQTPPDMLQLATVQQTWDGLPKVTNDATKAVHMSDLENMRSAIHNLYDLLAIERLKSDARDSTPSAVHGVFVDPFFDDDMRDQGTKQSGAIVRGALVLPISGAMAEFPDIKEQLTLPYTTETVLEQTWKTGSMQINPYQAFDPLPVLVALDPAIDRWSYLNTEAQWTSDVTRNFFQGQGSASSTSTTKSVELANVIVEDDVHLRIRDVGIKASNLGPGETFQVLIDSVPAVSQTTRADANGKIDTKFTIPVGVPSGARLVEIVGTDSSGMATYTGLGTISTNVFRNVTSRVTTFFTPSPPSVDPLAQTFVLPAGRHLVGVDVWFTKKGISTVRVQIRETSTGIPNRTVVAEGEIQASQIVEGASNRVVFPFPVYLSGDVEYALVVMTDTPDHELAIAELGGWDVDKGLWVKGQPYATGVLLSSSNASTWTPHQNADLWFKLVGAKFSPLTRRVTLGNVTMDGVTELMPLADLLMPVSGTDATFIVSKAGIEVARVQAGQVLSLSERLSGAHKIEVELTGREISSPILFDGTQLLMGKVGESGDYISRSFPCGVGKKVSVRLDTLTPGGSKVQVYVQTSASGWTEATLDSFDEIGDGWRRMNYSAPCGRQETCVKIEITGTPAERPRVSSLRGVVLDA